MTDTPPSKELIQLQFQHITQKLDEILTQVKATNGRVDRAEDDIIRLQERTSPWGASGITGVVILVIGSLYEYFRR